MKQLKTILIFFLFLGVIGCKEDKKIIEETPVDAGISTFYFIRHAEKERGDPENVDPELNQDGLGRAMHWAEILIDVELDAIYSTDYARTAMTAAATSVKKDVDVEYYDPQTIDIDQFKVDNLNKKVLVVGHSNTTPDFVNSMIGEDKYYAMDDDDNGSLFIVQIVNGIATSQQLHINCNCPDERE
jgi:broad specificity phosphatase PhoE